MKSFLEFLKESKEFEKSVDSKVKKMLSMSVDGDDVLVPDENDQILEGSDIEEKFEKSSKSTMDALFGPVGETMYIGGTGEEINESTESFPYPNEQMVDESKTTDYLLKIRKNPRKLSHTRRSAQYKLVKDKTSESGYKILRKSDRFDDFEDGEDIDKSDDAIRHELTNAKGEDGRSEIDDILDQLNRPPKVNRFDFDGDILKMNGRPLNPRSKEKWIKIFNEYAGAVYPGKVFRFEVVGKTDDGKDKLGNRMFTNDNELESDPDNDQILNINSSTYTTPLTDEQKEVISRFLTAKGTKKKSSDAVFGYDDKAKCFTINGEKITDKEDVSKLIRRLNAGLYQQDDEKWEHFAFAKEGSKVGKHVGSFSLPPIASCQDGVPCAGQGCYAIKSFGLRPFVGTIWENNFALLKEGKERIQQFVSECVNFIKDNKLKFFRYHVSGDVFDGGDDYCQALFDIADECPDVKFWTYTKNYNVYKGKKAKHGNFVVLMSAWGKFVPPDDMITEHPVAYLYDPDDENNEENIKKYVKNGEPQICPCTINNVKTVNCENCDMACWKKGADDNLGFRKH